VHVHVFISVLISLLLLLHCVHLPCIRAYAFLCREVAKDLLLREAAQPGAESQSTRPGLARPAAAATTFAGAGGGTNPSSPPATAVGGTNVSPCPPRMPCTRLIAVFAFACIYLNVTAAIAIPTAA
jgi:hypothetical protein